MSTGERKRKSLEPATERPNKVARTEAAPDPFDPSREIIPATIPDGFSPLSNITGTIMSTWPINADKIKRFLLRVHDAQKLSVLVTIRSGDLSQLDVLTAGSPVTLSLEDADMLRLDITTVGADTLPFKLVYPRGAGLKLRDKLIDTRKPAPNDDDWFDTPANTSSISLDEVLAPEDTTDYTRLSPITEVVTDLPPVSQAPILDDDTSHVPTPRKSSAVPSGTIIPGTTGVSAETSTTSIISTEAPSTSAGPSATNQTTAAKPKRKRIRKRDTRHSNNPAIQATKPDDPAKAQEAPKVEEKAKSNGQAKLQNKMDKIEKKVEASGSKTSKFPGTIKKTSPNKKMPPKEPRPNAGFTNTLGGTYPALADLTADARVQVAGVVVRAGAPKRTRSGDWMVTYSITDPSVFPERDFSINFFREREDALPTAKLEEAILLRALKTTTLNEQVAGVGYKDNFVWAAYEPSHGKEYTGAWMGFKMDQAELRYCHELCDWWREKRAPPEGAQNVADAGYTQMARRRRAQVELKDMKEDVFCDCLVQVVKIWHDNQSTDMYVTDYTENPGFGDPNQSGLSLSGPQSIPLPNSFVCKINLWNEAKARAETIQPLQFFQLKNIRVRYSRGGNLEGSMGMGKDGKENLMQLAEGDERLKDLRKRKILFLKGDVDAVRRAISAAELPTIPREPPMTPQIPPAEQACVSGMKQGIFYTFVAEVLKTFRAVNFHDFYVTDYTEHPYLMDFSTVDTWQPPPGRRTLQISVFDDEYRAQAASLVPGCFARFEYMLFRKVHPKKKLGDGKEIPPFFSGKIGGMVQRPCGIRILQPTDPDVKTLLRRKADVLKVKIESLETQASQILSRRAPSLAPLTPKNEDHPASLPTPNTTQSTGHLSLRSVSPPSAQPRRTAAQPSNQPDGLLTSIFHNMPMSTFSGLKDSQPAPGVWKVRARVVAFQPGRLRDWVRQECARCHAAVPINQRQCLDCVQDDDEDGDETLPVARWRFAFVLQDEQGDTLPNVFCCDDTATTFLGDLPPENLVSHRETLKLLRQRITPLLGNLEAVQQRLIKQEEDLHRPQSTKRLSADSASGGKEKGKMKDEELSEDVRYGTWADWTVRSWLEEGERRWGVFGCRVVV